jgi:hypothetical protein
MTTEEFRQSLAGEEPPANLSLALAGLWWDGKGNWQKAHESAQQDEGAAGAWVHAYLHRKEGDPSNAGYWYRRAGKTPTKSPLEQEWLEIVGALLRAGAGN